MSEIKAIETEYKGYKFRSRLEARWAVFFDLMGIRWMYEIEGYKTSCGLYVPDFWLPDVYMRWLKTPGVFFEVKPQNHESDTHSQLEEIANELNCGAVLAKGFEVDRFGDWQGLIQIAPGWDRPMLFYRCPCGAIKFEFPNTNYCDCPRGGNCESDYNFFSTPITEYERALAHRFW